MPLFAQHPELAPELAKTFREEHEKLFEEATFIATNNSQVVKFFSLDGGDFVIKRYPEKGPRANLRSLLGVSRAMNSFSKSALLSDAGVQTPAHLFVARHLGFRKGMSYLIMEKSRGASLYPMLFEDPPRTISPLLIENLVGDDPAHPRRRLRSRRSPRGECFCHGGPVSRNHRPRQSSSQS